MGARRIRREQIQHDQKVSRRENGILKVKERARRLMRGHRVRSQPKARRMDPLMRGRHGPHDAIHAREDALEPSAGHCALNTSVGVAMLDELTAGQHAVLTFGHKKFLVHWSKSFAMR